MKRFDFAIPVGLLIGLTAIGSSALLEGIGINFLWQPAAALVVLGGTLGAVVVRRGWSGVQSAIRACLNLNRREDPDALRASLARLAWLARAAKRDGVRVYENSLATNRDPLINCALKLTADFTEPVKVRQSLDRVLDEEDARGAACASTVEAAGTYAPTFGILGAVLGLVHVLRSVAEPSSLGFGIATAFVATIYGVGIANLLLLPLAARLRERHTEFMRSREVLADALVALAAGESPGALLNHFTAHTADAAPIIRSRAEQPAAAVNS